MGRRRSGPVDGGSVLPEGCGAAPGGTQPQAAEPSDFEDDFGDDPVDVLVVPTLEDDFDDEPDDEEESADEPPEPFDCAVLLAASLPPPERLPPLAPLPELLLLRESFRESLL